MKRAKYALKYYAPSIKFTKIANDIQINLYFNLKFKISI